MSEIRRTVMDLAPGEDVELVLEPCGCAPDIVCSDHDAFAALCPRRVGVRYLVMRGTAEGRKYVRKLLPDIGEVDWTDDREAAHRFPHRTVAAYVQGCIVAHDGGAVAVVPETPNTSAMAALNRVAEW